LHPKENEKIPSTCGFEWKYYSHFKWFSSNAAKLQDTGHAKGRLCKGGIGKGKKTKNLSEVDVSLYKNGCRNFKLGGATTGERGELEEASPLELEPTYAWEEHKEAPCVAIFSSN
jgi:hypothetical protein